MQADPQPSSEGLLDWQPAQYKTQAHIDLRQSAVGPKGFKEFPLKGNSLSRVATGSKRRRDEGTAMAEGDAGPTAMDEDGQEPAEASVKRQRVEGAPYRKVSGKTWKLTGNKAGADLSAVVGTSWEKKMAAKAQRTQFMEQKKAAVDAQKEKRVAKAKQKREALERKKANQEKSAVVQKISNTATVKKMMKSKKQKKLLRTADTS